MFGFFKMRSDDTKIEARPDSPMRSAPLSNENSENVSDVVILDSLTSLSKMNGISVFQQGACLAVMDELIVSILENRLAAMRTDIVESFRNRIENLMSPGDERSLLQQYNSSLLTEVNRYRNVLR